MDTKNFISTLGEGVEKTANIRTVYGDPVSAEGKTIIPVAKIAYGFGGGSGTSEKGGEEGQGGGAGFAAKPVGVVEITSAGTRFISFFDRRKIAFSALMGLFLGFWIGKRRRN